MGSQNTDGTIIVVTVTDLPAVRNQDTILPSALIATRASPSKALHITHSASATLVWEHIAARYLKTQCGSMGTQCGSTCKTSHLAQRGSTSQLKSFAFMQLLA